MFTTFDTYVAARRDANPAPPACGRRRLRSRSRPDQLPAQAVRDDDQRTVFKASKH